MLKNAIFMVIFSLSEDCVMHRKFNYAMSALMVVTAATTAVATTVREPVSAAVSSNTIVLDAPFRDILTVEAAMSGTFSSRVPAFVLVIR